MTDIGGVIRVSIGPLSPMHCTHTAHNRHECMRFFPRTPIRASGRLECKAENAVRTQRSCPIRTFAKSMLQEDLSKVQLRCAAGQPASIRVWLGVLETRKFICHAQRTGQAVTLRWLSQEDLYLVRDGLNSTGYAHPAYVDSLSEFGRPVHLRARMPIYFSFRSTLSCSRCRIRAFPFLRALILPAAGARGRRGASARLTRQFFF